MIGVTHVLRGWIWSECVNNSVLREQRVCSLPLRIVGQDWQRFPPAGPEKLKWNSPCPLVKLCDFGVARLLTASPTIIQSDTHYQAPKLSAKQPATTAADVFSFAIVTFEIITGRLLTSFAPEKASRNRFLTGLRPKPGDIRMSADNAYNRW